MDNKIDFDELFISGAENILDMQNNDGSFFQTNNGPRNQLETSIRSTSHIAIYMFKVYEITNEEKYLQASIKACKFLVRHLKRNKYMFVCFEANQKLLLTNGLIGQAWGIESLIYVGIKTNNNEFLMCAERNIENHCFSSRKFLWHNSDIDGKKREINYKLNQQIWFSANALILSKHIKNSEIFHKSELFFKNIKKHISYIPCSRIIYHTIPNKRKKLSFLKYFIYRYLFKKDIVSEVETSYGYFSFLLYGIAFAYSYTKNESFWEKIEIQKLINKPLKKYIKDIKGDKLINNRYAWSYNPTGIEISYVLQAFPNLNLGMNISYFLNKQLALNYDWQNKLMKLNTNDPNILLARFYESSRLDNIEVSME